jgi:ubiquinone/menaquinone biosynthesis C-methylase UbiE
MQALPKSQAPSSWSGPLAHAAGEVSAAARELGRSQWASTVRAWCVPYLFHGMEDVFKGSADPAIGLTSLFGRLTAYLKASAASGLGTLSPPAGERDTTSVVERVTGEHYGRLFREFDAEAFASEPARLLKARLERNDVRLPDLAKARVLDAGCGGGRYSVAWHLLGAGDVLGVDLSEPGIADAKARSEAMKLQGVRFDRCDVVELPLPDNSFNIVFSNGVLHHTRDWQTGIRNLVRVLEPGGLGWLYLIENPGGYFWDTIELLRDVMANEVHEHARVALANLGLPANRIFYMLDHVMVPINLRLTAEEITSALADSGAKNIRRLQRGADFDRVERIHQGDPFARDKYGAGEHRFVFTK